MKKILAIDDNELDLVVYSRVLRNTAYALKTASSLKEARELLANESFDAVLSDFYLDGENGLDCLDLIQKTDARIPVIVMTGSDDEELRSESKKHGAAKVLSKELLLDDKQELVRCLDALTDR